MQHSALIQRLLIDDEYIRNHTEVLCVAEEDTMGVIGWIIFGALAGWMASIIAGTNGRQGCLANIVIGIVGAFVGGFLIEFLTGRGVNFDFNFRSFAVAVIGSLVLLFITGAMRRR